MPRSHFTLRVLLLAMLVVGAFFGGIRFERERQRIADAAATAKARANQPYSPPWFYMGGYATQTWPDGRVVSVELPKAQIELGPFDGSPTDTFDYAEYIAP